MKKIIVHKRYFKFVDNEPLKEHFYVSQIRESPAFCKQRKRESSKPLLENRYCYVCFLIVLRCASCLFLFFLHLQIQDCSLSYCLNYICITKFKAKCKFSSIFKNAVMSSSHISYLVDFHSQHMSPHQLQRSHTY